MPPTTTHPKPLHLPSTLPTPLPPQIRDRTLTSLLASQTIPTLQQTLRAECASAGWFDAMRARVFEIVDQDAKDGKQGYDVNSIRDILIAEALGKKVGGKRDRGGVGEEEDEYEDDGTGMMVRKKAKTDEKEEEGKAKEGRKTDVRLPEQAIEAGTKVVRDALEKVVVIEGDGV